MFEKVREYVEKGWSTSKQYIPPDVIPYYSREILYQNGFLFKSGRIVGQLYENMTKRLHS